VPTRRPDPYGEDVRASGLLDRPAGVERGDHVCWAYDDDAAFEDAAVRFLAEGLVRGDRLLWVGDGADGRLRRSTGPLADVDGLTARGALRVLSVAEGYAAAGPFTPERQLAFYDDATRRAIDEGYRGLRVVAEITSLAADEAQRAQLLRWEHLADDFVAHGPGFTALCAYRHDLLPDDAVADVASLHPLSHGDGPAAAFRVWFDEGALHVAGDVDAFTAGRLARLLASTHVGARLVTLDLAGLTFVDLAGVRAIVHWARALAGDDRRLELRGASRLFRRMWELLTPDGLAAVTFAERQR
jgi:ABC-type transporter Mla MlaB component